MMGSRCRFGCQIPLFVEWLPKHYSVVLAEALRDAGRPTLHRVRARCRQPATLEADGSENRAAQSRATNSAQDLGSVETETAPSR